MWFIDFYPESEKQDGRMGSGRLCAARSSPWVHGRLGAAAGCGRPAPQCDRATQIARLGKDPNSQLNVHFLLNTYHFYTIVKLKMVALKHHKLGFLSIYILITCFQVYASSQSPPPPPNPVRRTESRTKFSSPCHSPRIAAGSTEDSKLKKTP